jgi:hypothetical protein
VAGDLALVKQMVASGADVSMRYDPDDKIPDPHEAITLSRRRQTILHIAAATLEPEMREYLTSAGAPLDAKNEQGETPLDLAIIRSVIGRRFSGRVRRETPRSLRRLCGGRRDRIR